MNDKLKTIKEAIDQCTAISRRISELDAEILRKKTEVLFASQRKTVADREAEAELAVVELDTERANRKAELWAAMQMALAVRGLVLGSLRCDQLVPE